MKSSPKIRHPRLSLLLNEEVCLPQTCFPHLFMLSEVFWDHCKPYSNGINSKCSRRPHWRKNSLSAKGISCTFLTGTGKYSLNNTSGCRGVERKKLKNNPLNSVGAYFNGLFNLPAGTTLTSCYTYFKEIYAVLGNRFILSCET